MLVKEIINRFKEKRPVALMARMALARLLAPQAIDQVFHDHAQEQYQRKIPCAFTVFYCSMDDMLVGISGHSSAAGA
jgi:phosphoglucomutase